MARGFFVSFEGGEGVGKSEQAKRISQRLEQNKIEHIFLREPGGTDISEDIRNILLNSKYIGIMSPRAELLLYEAARAQIVAQVIYPYLRKGALVLTDRFYDSSTAYQGYGRGMDISQVEELNIFATMGIKPNLTFYFDLPIEVGFARKKKQTSNKLNRLELEHKKFHARLNAGFKKIAKDEPNRVVTINANRKIEIIHEEVWNIFWQRYQTFNKDRKVF